MGRDRSLDEFVGSESGASTASGTDPDANGSDDTDRDEGAGQAATAPDDVEPAAVTYRWEPDGVRCADCGTTVDVLWSGESGQVCAECKEW